MHSSELAVTRQRLELENCTIRKQHLPQELKPIYMQRRCPQQIRDATILNYLLVVVTLLYTH